MIAREVLCEEVERLRDGVDEINKRNLEVKRAIDAEYSCENPKLLEAIMEHILFHWDDTVELLMDELIEEEAEALNAMEMERSRV